MIVRLSTYNHCPIWCESRCCKSIAKTNRLLVIDEDVPGGASATFYNKS
jgi:hypothetical protein